VTPRVPLIVAVAALLVAILALYQSRLALDEARIANGAGASGGSDGSRGQTIPLAGAPALGDPAAKVALIEFSDYECPYCIRHFQQTMPRLAQEYVKTSKVRYVFRDWPVDQLHPQAIRAHVTAFCAGEQKRYWELHQQLFGPAGSHTSERLLGLARQAGLDMDAFSNCVASERSERAVRETSRLAMELGAIGTPHFIVGLRDPAKDVVTVLQSLSGAQPYEVFAKAIDEAIRVGHDR
jgi:protein-disulfide isomerase